MSPSVARRSSEIYGRGGEAVLAASVSGFLLGGMLDEEPDKDLGDELEVDEEEISACAPYLARQMSWLGRVTPGVKDTSF